MANPNPWQARKRFEEGFKSKKEREAYFARLADQASAARSYYARRRKLEGWDWNEAARTADRAGEL